MDDKEVKIAGSNQILSSASEASLFGSAKEDE